MIHMIRDLLRRLLLWALDDDFKELRNRVRAAMQGQKNTQNIARKALDAAGKAEHRAQCITSMDVPIYKSSGVVTITAVVRGQTIVHAFVIPPMEDIKELHRLISLLETSYGAIDFLDAPHSMAPMIREIMV